MNFRHRQRGSDLECSDRRGAADDRMWSLSGVARAANVRAASSRMRASSVSTTIRRVADDRKSRRRSRARRSETDASRRSIATPTTTSANLRRDLFSVESRLADPRNAKLFFGRSPAVGAPGTRRRRHFVSVLSMRIVGHSRESTLRSCIARKSGEPHQSLLSGIFDGHRRIFIWMSRRLYVSYVSGERASVGSPPGIVFGHPAVVWELLVSVENLLTRAQDSNSFCAGVTNE